MVARGGQEEEHGTSNKDQLMLSLKIKRKKNEEIT